MNKELIEKEFPDICWEGVKWIQNEIQKFRKDIVKLRNFEYDEYQGGILDINRKIREVVEKEIAWREEFLEEYIEQLAEVGISPEDKL